jgi:tetratricopeptide (TPR) repeat protein
MDLYCETLLPMLDYGWSDLIGVRTARWKYIDAPQRELYDLARDPWEIDNLADKLPGQVDEMRRRLAGLLAGETGVPAESWSAMKMTDEMRRNLQSLGYVGGPASGESAARPVRADSLGIRTPTGRDPKDVIGVFGRIQNGALAMYRRDWDEAIRQLGLALAIEPNNKAAHRFMGDCYRQKNILGKAEEQYQLVLAADPHFPQVLNNLGALYIDLGRYPEALDLLRRAVAARASMADAHNNLGAVLQEMGKLDEAIPSFRHAVELDPSMVAARMNLAGCYAQKGMWAEVAPQLEEVLKLDPGNVNAQRGLRAARRQLGAAGASPRGS